VDDHAIVRECVRAILEREDAMTVVGLAATGEQAISAAQRLKPDLLVMDLMLPGLNGADATRQVLDLLPRVHVIMLSCSYQLGNVQGALRAGARGYVVKEAVGSELACAVRTVMAGKQYLSPQLESDVIDAAPDADGARPLWEHLSAREREVLRRTAAGTSTAQIALQLSLSPKTVDTYRSRVMRKLGLSNRSNLIRYAMQHSLSHY